MTKTYIRISLQKSKNTLIPILDLKPSCIVDGNIYQKNNKLADQIKTFRENSYVIYILQNIIN